jgi:hypothetical protein
MNLLCLYWFLNEGHCILEKIEKIEYSKYALEENEKKKILERAYKGLNDEYHVLEELEKMEYTKYALEENVKKQIFEFNECKPYLDVFFRKKTEVFIIILKILFVFNYFLVFSRINYNFKYFFYFPGFLFLCKLNF